MTYQDVFIIIGVLLAGSLVFMGLIILQKYYKKNSSRKSDKLQTLIVDKFIFDKEINFNISAKRFIKNFFLLSQKFRLTKERLDDAYNYLYQRNYIHKLSIQMNAKNRYKRVEAITYLSLFKNDKTIHLLCERLLIEQKEHIKILIVNALKYKIDTKVLQCIITSLINSKRYYQKRVIQILKRYINQSEHDLSVYFKSPLIEIKEAFVELTQHLYHPSFEQPLKDTLEEIENHYILHQSKLLSRIKKPRVDRLYRQTLTALSTYYSFDLSDIKYLSNVDDSVVQIAIKSLARKGDFSTIE